jgi:hypothetical protein
MKKFVILLVCTVALATADAQVFLDPFWQGSNVFYGDVWRYNGSIAV